MSRHPTKLKVDDIKWVGGLIFENIERSLNIAGYSDSQLSILTQREVFNSPIDPNPSSISISKGKDGQTRFSISSNQKLVVMGNFGPISSLDPTQVSYSITHITRTDYIKQTLYTQYLNGAFNARAWNASIDELILGTDSHLSNVLDKLDFSPKILVHYNSYSSVFTKPNNWMKPSN